MAIQFPQFIVAVLPLEDIDRGGQRRYGPPRIVGVAENLADAEKMLNEIGADEGEIVELAGNPVPGFPAQRRMHPWRRPAKAPAKARRGRVDAKMR